MPASAKSRTDVSPGIPAAISVMSSATTPALVTSASAPVPAVAAPPISIILRGPSTTSRTFFTALPPTLEDLLAKARKLFNIPTSHTPYITLGSDERAIILEDSMPFLRDRELLITRWNLESPSNKGSRPASSSSASTGTPLAALNCGSTRKVRFCETAVEEEDKKKKEAAQGNGTASPSAGVSAAESSYFDSVSSSQRSASSNGSSSPKQTKESASGGIGGSITTSVASASSPVSKGMLYDRNSAPSSSASMRAGTNSSANSISLSTSLSPSHKSFDTPISAPTASPAADPVATLPAALAQAQASAPVHVQPTLPLATMAPGSIGSSAMARAAHAQRVLQKAKERILREDAEAQLKEELEREAEREQVAQQERQREAEHAHHRQLELEEKRERERQAVREREAEHERERKREEAEEAERACLQAEERERAHKEEEGKRERLAQERQEYAAQRQQQLQREREQQEQECARLEEQRRLEENKKQHIMAAARERARARERERQRVNEEKVEKAEREREEQLKQEAQAQRERAAHLEREQQQEQPQPQEQDQQMKQAAPTVDLRLSNRSRRLSTAAALDKDIEPEADVEPASSSTAVEDASPSPPPLKTRTGRKQQHQQHRQEQDQKHQQNRSSARRKQELISPEMHCDIIPASDDTLHEQEEEMEAEKAALKSATSKPSRRTRRRKVDEYFRSSPQTAIVLSSSPIVAPLQLPLVKGSDDVQDENEDMEDADLALRPTSPLLQKQRQMHPHEQAQTQLHAAAQMQLVIDIEDADEMAVAEALSNQSQSSSDMQPSPSPTKRSHDSTGIWQARKRPALMGRQAPVAALQDEQISAKDSEVREQKDEHEQTHANEIKKSPIEAARRAYELARQVLEAIRVHPSNTGPRKALSGVGAVHLSDILKKISTRAYDDDATEDEAATGAYMIQRLQIDLKHMFSAAKAFHGPRSSLVDGCEILETFASVYIDEILRKLRREAAAASSTAICERAQANQTTWGDLIKSEDGAAQMLSIVPLG
ncbi:hypothetical protein K437DRAFT_258487 [Tilletiaria anomala UBC 951]|uniref:Uncharacterized protein n=1 Tax=Tilletiaria anomala (strain ATCC 24038 / CBS 436.72 / UBC 951) TaxID=1037660 RepID=A0A066VQ23_TILAU|nr:uncharacterized protein K437DRAFT_258487 [Tilletiaria anomala UBC 951]KDN40869.1 hypothetical protein K437DRAFT_258487 [Tilletiaria anomala UBC 951]